MPVTRLRAAQYPAQPWKNGLGVSRMIAEFPPGASFDSVLWQVGSTEIGADCPFSDLPGLDRQFMVIEGAGVELACVDDTNGASVRKRIHALNAPFAFRGDWRTSCRLLGGPVRVLNVITRRGLFSAEIEIVKINLLNSLKKAADETLLAVELGALDAWLLAGHAEESCAFAPAPGVERLVLVRIRASGQ
jgi:uncharacterized protein